MRITPAHKVSIVKSETMSEDCQRNTPTPRSAGCKLENISRIAQRSTPLHISDNQIDPLEMGSLLAEGSRFVVYEHPWHGEELDFRHVVKKARPHIATNAEFIKRLNRFSDRLMALRHTHIEDVAAVQFGLGDCALLCERIDGENLAQVLQKGGRPTLEDARIICKQVAEALDAAHSVGFFHGCLSPERIHFTQEYKPGGGGLIHVKVRGFGMGKPLTGGLFGTPSYLAPEQVDPDATSLDPTPLAEQFVLASLLIEMLTGRQAFGGLTLQAVRNKLLRQDPTHIEWRGASQEDIRRVHRVIERALHKRPEQRFPRLSDFVAELERPGLASVLLPVGPLHRESRVEPSLMLDRQKIQSDLPTLHVLPSRLGLGLPIKIPSRDAESLAQLRPLSRSGQTPTPGSDPNATVLLTKQASVLQKRERTQTGKRLGAWPLWSGILLLVGAAVVGIGVLRRPPRASEHQTPTLSKGTATATEGAPPARHTTVEHGVPPTMTVEERPNRPKSTGLRGKTSKPVGPPNMKPRADKKSPRPN